MIRRATRSDIPVIRERLEELPNPPYLPSDDDVATMFEAENSVAVVGDAGEFAHAHWSEINQHTTIIHLLPEGMSLGRMAPIALAVLEAIWDDVPQSRGRMSGGIFGRGFDPGTDDEDYGQSKADAWANFVQGMGADRPIVTAVYDSAGVRTGTEARMLIALAIRSLRLAISG